MWFMILPKNPLQQSSMSKATFADFVIVTGNKNKLREINQILGTNHQLVSVDVPEIQSLDLDEVIKSKATAAFQKIKKPVLVTDVSLEIEALCGLPGPFVKYFVETLGAAKTVDLIKGKSRKAKVTDLICLFDGKNMEVFKGIVEGTLSDKPRGKSGFGFDAVFIPAGSKKTYAQMTRDEKNRISHRSIALRKLKEYLNL